MKRRFLAQQSFLSSIDMEEPESMFGSGRKLFKRQIFKTKHAQNSHLLAPGEEPVDIYARRLSALVGFAALAILVILPSHQIAPVLQVKFPFDLPARISEGGALMFPMRDNDQIVRVGLAKPSKLPEQKMYLAGFGLGSADQVTVWSLSKPQHLGWFKRQWLSKPLDYSEQTVAVDRLPQKTVTAHLVPFMAKQFRKTASVDVENEKLQADSLLTRTDGNARLDCWQAPLPFAMSSDFGTIRAFDNGQSSIHDSVDFKASIGTALKSVGSGEVVSLENQPSSGRTITIYHGDGLYTRYSHLHEFQTHVGEKVATGQMIGFSGQSGRAESPYLRFEVLWHGQHLNPADLLRVSQQFCPTTKNPLAQKTNHADRSPASKIYRWMAHKNGH